VQVMPILSAFLEMVPAQKRVLGTSWAGPPNAKCSFGYRDRVSVSSAEVYPLRGRRLCSPPSSQLQDRKDGLASNPGDRVLALAYEVIE